MGIKLLILQMIPWCFPMMGSTCSTGCHQAHRHVAAPSSPTVVGAGDDEDSKQYSVKLILADGTVEVYHRPVSAAELMMVHPMHLVCRSDAFTIGQRIPALEEGEQLQPGRAYFLLPAHFFQSVLSFVTLASAIALLQQRPLDVRKTPSGSLQIRLSDEVVGKAAEAAQELGEGGGRWEGGGRVCTTAALEKDYRQLVAGSRSRQWRPKLETIKESERGRGKLVAVGGAGEALGDIGRRRKKLGHRKQPKQQQQQQEQEQQLQQKQQRLQQHKAEDLPKYCSLHPLDLPHRSKGKKVVACDL